MKRDVIKTIRVKLHSLTNVKERLLSREYKAFQRAVEGEDADLYSATEQQARKVRRQQNPRDEQPVVLRNDVLAVAEQDLPLSKHLVKVPVYNPETGRGDSVWCPAIVPQKDYDLVREGNIADSELVRRGGEWFVHLVVKRQHKLQNEYDDLLAVDMGARGSQCLWHCQTATPRSTARPCAVSANTTCSSASVSGRRKSRRAGK